MGETITHSLLVFLDILSSESLDSEQHPNPKLFVFLFVFSSNVGTFEKEELTIPPPVLSRAHSGGRGFPPARVKSIKAAGRRGITTV